MKVKLSKREVKRILNTAWKKRLNLRIRGSKLITAGINCHDKAAEFLKSGNNNKATKFYKRGDKLILEGYNLKIWGSYFWTRAIERVYGRVHLQWSIRPGKPTSACKLPTGELFES